MTDQLRNGTKKLATISTKQVNVKHLSKPLKAKDSDTHKVPNMGTGLSPYMIAVGLFVGALATGIFYNLNEVEYKPRTVREWFFQKAAVFVTIAVAQGLIVIGGLIIFDGLKPNQIGMTFLVAIISALAYMLFGFNDEFVLWPCRLGSCFSLVSPPTFRIGWDISNSALQCFL
ncbi:YhgE/Pip family protein [Oenococcus oeni]|uniref:YhgE/Pip family protein n=1 Tax=Oenococcus oeni TaxID=1247 RepID=UPI00242DC0DE|nr:YhgE/Pip family protein [Oenococcus oeni]